MIIRKLLPFFAKQIDTTSPESARATPNGETSAPTSGVVRTEHLLAVAQAYGGIDLYEQGKKCR